MTELTITPKIADKTARFKGTVAAGEHVAVTIKGGAEWLGEDDGANLTLRVLDLVTGRTLAVFPRPEETYGEDEEYVPDEWGTAGEDDADLFCNLNLNTDRMVAAARHMLRVPVLFVMGAKDEANPATTRTLYFRDRYEVEFWPERVGDDTPYDLDKWPKQIDGWAEQVTAWGTRLDAMKLSAVRTEADGENPGKTTITLNDGTAQTDTVVEILDGQVTPAQMNTAIAAMGATKQNKLTFDAIPTEDSDNPVKSGGVYGAVKEVADAVAEHAGNVNIHVTAAQKAAWTAKYAKPQGGIPKSDLAQAVKDSLGKADTAVQAHQSLDAYVNAAGYDSTAKEIQLKHDSTVVARIDATAFIKDGMISEVKIVGDNLVIVFNADAGKEPISIPLSQIFNPVNYYDKTAADNRFVQKETGKGLVAVDATLTTSGAAADAKAVGDALRSGFTEWEFSGQDAQSGHEYTVVFENGSTYLYDGDSELSEIGAPLAGETSIDFNSGMPPVQVTATRHLITPTKTSQLTNDGPSSGPNVGHPFATTNQIPAPVDISGKLDGAAAYPAWEAGTAYNEGYIVSHNGRLWRAIEDSESSEPNSESASWEEVMIGDLKQDALSPAQIAAVNSGATAAKVATWDEYAAQIAQKASMSDLPYALVAPGEWEFSDGESHVVNGPIFDGEMFWYYTIDNSNTSQIFETEADALAALSLTFDSDPEITATRASLPGHLLDRAGNRVVVTGDTTLTLPEIAHAGKARDFLVRLEISGSTVPTITFSPDGNESVTYETDGDEFPVPDEAGTWLYAFTESCVAHKFAVSLKKVQTVAQGGGA